MQKESHKSCREKGNLTNVSNLLKVSLLMMMMMAINDYGDDGNVSLSFLLLLMTMQLFCCLFVQISLTSNEFLGMSSGKVCSLVTVYCRKLGSLLETGNSPGKRFSDLP